MKKTTVEQKALPPLEQTLPTSPSKKNYSELNFIIRNDSGSPSKSKRHQRTGAIAADKSIFQRLVTKAQLELPILKSRSPNKAAMSSSVGPKPSSFSPKKHSSSTKQTKDALGLFSLDSPLFKERQMGEMLENIVKSQITSKFQVEHPFRKNKDTLDIKTSSGLQIDEAVCKTVGGMHSVNPSTGEKSFNFMTARNSQSDIAEFKLAKGKSFRPLKKEKENTATQAHHAILSRVNLADSELAQKDVTRKFTIKKLSERVKKVFENSSSAGTKNSDPMYSSTQDS